MQRLAGAREVADTTLHIPHPYPDGAAEQWIAGHVGAWERQERATFAITEASLGLVGAIGLHLELAQYRAELGYWIGVPYWGRGYASEAARAILAFAFATFPLRRVSAHHMTRNAASGRVMVKAGMEFEGVLRRAVVKDGRSEDIAVYAMVKP